MYISYPIPVLGKKKKLRKRNCQMFSEGIDINVALVALYSGRQLAWLNVGFALHILPMRKLAALQRALSLLNSLRTRPRGWQARGWRVWGCAGSAGQHSVVGWAGMRPVLLLLSIAEVWAVLRGKLINKQIKYFLYLDSQTTMIAKLYAKTSTKRFVVFSLLSHFFALLFHLPKGS